MFRTKVELPTFTFNVHHQHAILSIGSCFSENIGQRLQMCAFDAITNPMGVVYNPVSVANTLENLMAKERFDVADLTQFGNLHGSFAHSTLYSHTVAHESLKLINKDFLQAKTQLSDADLLFITFGTSWVFELIESGQVVANCHKLSAKNFRRRRLQVFEIVEIYQSLFAKLFIANPKLKIVFTVSPVRHWKDGPTENNISKAILLMAIQEIQKLFSHNVFYFPSYEIVVDELRDYRFYAADMLHPAPIAIDYIWQQFGECFFDNQTKALNREIEALRKSVLHRPLHPNTAEYEKFKQSIRMQQQTLLLKFPWLANRLTFD